MRVKKKIYQYVMLLVSIVMLMSVVVPHHHIVTGCLAINHFQPRRLMVGMEVPNHMIADATGITSHSTLPFSRM